MLSNIRSSISTNNPNCTNNNSLDPAIAGTLSSVATKSSAASSPSPFSSSSSSSSSSTLGNGNNRNHNDNDTKHSDTGLSPSMAKPTPFRRFKSKLAKKKEKAGSGDATIPDSSNGRDAIIGLVRTCKGRGKGALEGIVPDQLAEAGCSNDNDDDDAARPSAPSESSGSTTANVVITPPGPSGFQPHSPCTKDSRDKDPNAEQNNIYTSTPTTITNLTQVTQRIQTLLSTWPSNCNPSQFFSLSMAGSGSEQDKLEQHAPSPNEIILITPSQAGSHPNDDSHSFSSSATIPDPTPASARTNPKSALSKLHLTVDTKLMNFLTSLHSQESAKEGANVRKNDDNENLGDIFDKWTRFVIRKHFGKGKEKGKESSQGEEEEEEEDDDDDDGGSVRDDSSSVVISCPLEPLNESEVEVARSEILYRSTESSNRQPQQPFPPPTEQDNKPAFWTFRKDSQATRTTADSNGFNSSNKPTRLKEIRVWYPSRVKVSVEVTWWGYRIFLPPPVMQILSDKSLEAAKRAAMITAALTWLVSHIPIELVPPQFKPLSLLLKEIVPLVGYIGGFIAWSWNSVRGFDKGDGVILSATWLLPIALIPGTWVYTEEPNPDIPAEDVTVTKRSSPPSSPPLPPKDATSGFSGSSNSKSLLPGINSRK